MVTILFSVTILGGDNLPDISFFFPLCLMVSSFNVWSSSIPSSPQWSPSSGCVGGGDFGGRGGGWITTVFQGFLVVVFMVILVSRGVVV